MVRISAGDMTVNVNAAVQSLEGDIPVVRVIPQEITTDEVKCWAEVLFEGQSAYEPTTVLSKTV